MENKSIFINMDSDFVKYFKIYGEKNYKSAKKQNSINLDIAENSEEQEVQRLIKDIESEGD